jgi:hypothetical protein
MPPSLPRVTTRCSSCTQKAPADLERLRQLRPDALLASVAGSGHYLKLEVPDQVNAMLDRFLQIVASPP